MPVKDQSQKGPEGRPRALLHTSQGLADPYDVGIGALEPSDPPPLGTAPAPLLQHPRLSLCHTG